MKIYLAIDDRKEGPFTLFQVEEKLRAGELEDTTLGWYEGLEQWSPLRDLDPFESLFRLRDAEAENERKRQYAKRLASDAAPVEAPARTPLSALKVLARVAARGVDLMLFFHLAIAVMFALRSAGWIQLTYFQLFSQVLILLLPPWHLLEAYMITRWGTTPGKWLLGIHVTDRDGAHLDYSASLRRSLGVFVVGLACYVWFLTIIVAPFAFYFLWWQGRTFWDSTANAKVTHKPFHPRQIFLPLVLMFILSNLLQQPIMELNKELQEEWQALRQQSQQGTSN